MSNQEKPDYETRKQRALRRLGTNTPRCWCCPEDRWQCLELHHVAGQAHDDTVVIVCANDHKVLSDAQRDHPRAQDSADPYLDAIGRFLLGLADMLGIVIERLVEFGKALIEQARNPITEEVTP